MSETNSCIGIYNTHTEAENAIKELQKSGFDMKANRAKQKSRVHSIGVPPFC